MYARLGPVVFDLVTYWDGHEVKRGYEYAEHKVLEGKPKLQWTGDGLEELSIAVELHAVYCNPEEQLNILYDAAASHQALPLTMGSGVYRGRYILTHISQTTKHTDGQGRILSLSAKLDLKEWTGDARTPAGIAVAEPGQPVPGAVKTAPTPSAPANAAGPFSWVRDLVRFPA